MSKQESGGEFTGELVNPHAEYDVFDKILGNEFFVERDTQYGHVSIHRLGENRTAVSVNVSPLPGKVFAFKAPVQWQGTREGGMRKQAMTMAFSPRDESIEIPEPTLQQIIEALRETGK